MNQNRTLVSLAVCAMGFMAGCIAPEATISTHLYSPPVVSAEPTAFLTGSGEFRALGLAGLRTFPFAIDGLRVQDANGRSNMPVPLRPGAHTITAEFNAEPYYARADLELNAHDGEDYTIKFATDVATVLLGNAGGTFCEFWIIENKTGRTVTPINRVNVSKK